MKAPAGKTASLLLVTLMAVASLIMWVGVPIGWLWIGSQVQGTGRSLATSLVVIVVGIAICVTAMVFVLLGLNRAHLRVRRSIGLKDYTGLTAFEVVLVITAALSLAAFLFWIFILGGGSSPVPLGPTG